MSKVQLQGNVSGTGIFTIASPNSNTDRTLTLPDNTGTLLTSGSSIQRSQLPTGSVIQVVSAFSNSDVSTTSSSFTDFISASITPTSASNKILVLATYGEPDVLTGYVRVNLFRNTSTSIFTLTTEFGRGIPNTSESHYSGASVQYVDSPATTSSVTYSLGLAVAISGTARIGNGGDHSLVLMEVVG